MFKLVKYTCPCCGKVLVVGNIEGLIKCKRCGTVTEIIRFTR